MSKERQVSFLFNIMITCFMSFLFCIDAYPWPYPTYYQNCALDNAFNDYKYHADYFITYCQYGYIDERIRDYYETRTFSPSSVAYQCRRDVVGDHYTYYTGSCGIARTDETNSDTGMGCEFQSAITSLEFLLGDLTSQINNNGGPCPDGYCGVLPVGTETHHGEMSINLVLTCPSPYKGNTLSISANGFISSNNPLTGYEVLMNGVPPYHADISGGQVYNEWNIPISGNCGGKIILRPTVTEAYANMEITNLSATYKGLGIESPINNSDYDLVNGTYTVTQPISYRSHVEPYGGASVVNWSESLNYRTSGGRCSSCDSVRTFHAAPDSDYYYSFASLGGQATVYASAMINGEVDNAAPISLTVTGVAIPDTEITARLVSIYNGQTKNLMTGLAMKESSYIQFAQRDLYGKNDRWPNESYDGGSHIGLLMVETTMDRAWDWLRNTEFGVNFFQGTNTSNGEKMGLASFWENKIKTDARKTYGCNLRNLLNVERENMALVLYGPYASGNLTGQYYYYQAITVNKKTSCDWIINTANNSNGVYYANEVRSLCR